MTEIKDKPSKDKFIACTNGNKKYEIINPLGEIVRVKGKKMELQVMEDPDGFTFIIWKRRKYQVDILEKNQNKYTIMVNGIWYSFSIETPISFNRRKFLSKIVSSSRTETIIAPMPGKILDILVEENAELKQGETVVILEAMKMQNEILTHVSGKVKKIKIQKNDSVMKGDIMIEIEKS